MNNSKPERTPTIIEYSSGWMFVCRVALVMSLALLLAGNSQSAVTLRGQLPFSSTATYAGHPSWAQYVVDSGIVRQFDRNGKLRDTIVCGSSRFICSPSGSFYALISSNVSEFSGEVGEAPELKGEIESDSLLEDSQNRPLPIVGVVNGQRSFQVFTVTGVPLYTGLVTEREMLFLDDDGRCVIGDERSGSGVEFTVFDTSGTKKGYCFAPGCDTVIFAPQTRGFLVDALGKGLHFYRFSGEKVATYPPASVYSFSSKGKHLAHFQSGRVSLYTDAKLQSSFKAPKASAGKIIYDAEFGRVFLLTSRHLYVLRSKDGKELMDYPTLGEGRHFKDLDYNLQSNLLALTISVSRGTLVSKDQRENQCALRVITPEGLEQPFHYIHTKLSRPGYPRAFFGAGGRDVTIIAADRIHRVGGWQVE